jgi:hypothetical protein
MRNAPPSPRIWFRLLLSVVALAAGVAGAVIAVALVKAVLG